MLKQNVEDMAFPQSLTAPATQYIGFATVTYGVALYEGGTLIGAIPVAIAGGALKMLWAKTHEKIFTNKKNKRNAFPDTKKVAEHHQ